MDEAAAVSMVVMGVAIAGLWTRDILAGVQVDLTSGIWAARDPDAGTLLWPHWLAEYATAAALIAAAFGLLLDTEWGATLGGIATGALLYTSVNSLAWTLSKPERRTYAVPMLAGVVVGLFLVVHLLTR